MQRLVDADRLLWSSPHFNCGGPLDRTPFHRNLRETTPAVKATSTFKGLDYKTAVSTGALICNPNHATIILHFKPRDRPE